MAMSANLRVPALSAVPEILHVRPRKLTLAGSRTVRVLVAEDHVLLGDAIARFLDAEADLSVVGVARTGAEAVSVAAREGPDVVLMDCRLPDMSGSMAVGLIRTAVPGAVFIFHSAYDSEPILLDAIDSGAAAYLARSATAGDIVETIRRAAQGEVLIPAGFFAKAFARQREGVTERRRHEKLLVRFTPRELEVLNLLADGLDTTAMADRLGIADHTVEWHVRHLLKKLQVHSKLQAVIAAVNQGLVALGGSAMASGLSGLDIPTAKRRLRARSVQRSRTVAAVASRIVA
jgi:DNA-binding NarL/FixJ family response regulator